ncbi:MAG: hypothetical protein JWN75_226 [Candidatus Saccharibacteria bacterium]|nr:hypothetical protein [Candidatus Saccharibacteria bacterium]
MSATPTITIAGQDYDAVTGLPITESSQTHSIAKTSHANKVPAANLHAKPQRSVTLQRKTTKRPVDPKTEITGHVKKSPAVMSEFRHTHSDIRKFAPHPVAAVTRPKTMDIGHVTHPHVVKAHAISAAKAEARTAAPLSAAVIKADSIKHAVANTHKKQPLRSRLLPRQKIVGVLSATFALVLLGGYFTYLNMPSLSVRVAAAQAGIDASYPSYRPDGYALNGPVTYTDGRVSMNFKANAGEQNFTVSQSKSGWDSDAVLDHYVAPKAGSSYIPYNERGLTIYTYDNNAAWVNGGILYTVEGNAPLSSEQIRRIATSLL